MGKQTTKSKYDAAYIQSLESTVQEQKDEILRLRQGADSSAIVYTLVETAKANGVEPYAYLLRVLSLLPYLGRNPSNAELDELLPWHPRMLASLRRKDSVI